MSDADLWFYLNGRQVRGRDASISLLDRGIQWGDAVYDSIRTYAGEPFVRLRDTPPNIKHVVGTNFCDLSVRLATVGDTKTVVVFAAEDNTSVTITATIPPATV